MSALDRYLAPILGRVQMMITRGVIAAISDSTQAQSVQIELFADEVQDGVERWQGYGFTSHPHPGAEALAVFVGGTRSHGVIIQVEDRRYRLKDIAEGEVALFDDLGQVIHLKRDGIAIESMLKVTIDAPEIAVTGDTVTVDADSVAVTAEGATIDAQTVDVTADVVSIDSGDIRLGGAGGAKVARVGDDVDLGTGKIISGSDVVTAE